jgi:hypothetical protein
MGREDGRTKEPLADPPLRRSKRVPPGRRNWVRDLRHVARELGPQLRRFDDERLRIVDELVPDLLSPCTCLPGRG